MRKIIVVSAMPVVTMVLTLAAGARQATPSSWQRLEGAWVRTDPEGSGSFGGLGANIPAARLKPGVSMSGGGRGARGAGGGRGAPPTPADAAPHKEGDPYIAVAQPCGGGAGRSGGALLINPDSGGVHLVISKDEIVFAGERGGVRHIYMDGRPHPSPWLPTGAGHSVGHFEGDVLVVETTGLTAGGVPGGGVRSPATRLIERFQVAPDGRTMTLTYTWDDPAIYEQPHTYRYIFDRAPGDPAYALEEWCDASDPIEKQSIVPPKQIKGGGN
jgi:hypothetical protein